MSEIRSESSVGDRAIDRMTIDASGSRENELTCGGCRIVLREILLLLDPSVEVFACMHVHAEQHLGVLSAAILGALAQEKPGPFGLNPHRVHFVRNEVRLAG